MNTSIILILVATVGLVIADNWGGPQGSAGGYGGPSGQNGNIQQGQGRSQWGGNQQGQWGGNQQGRSAQQGGEMSPDGRRYGANFIDEQDRVGYEANIPGAQARYVQFREGGAPGRGGSGRGWGQSGDQSNSGYGQQHQQRGAGQYGGQQHQQGGQRGWN